MRKPYLVSILFVSLFSGAVLADQSAQKNVISVSGDDASGNQDFQAIEQMDQNMEQANKEIAAMKVQQQLASLKQSMESQSLGVSILRIQGFGDQLQAVASLQNGGVQVLSQGDLVSGHYRVSSISEDKVQVIDQENHKNYTLPLLVNDKSSKKE